MDSITSSCTSFGASTAPGPMPTNGVALTLETVAGGSSATCGALLAEPDLLGGASWLGDGDCARRLDDRCTDVGRLGAR